MARYVCKICGRNDFSSNDSVIQHIKSQHMGKLSDSSIEYLLKQGIKPNKIIEFCKKNKIKVDESKVYKIALKLIREEDDKK